VPIDKLLASAAFEPDAVALLASAFDTAWETVKRSGSPLAAEDRAAATREALARRIIEAGKKGERDVQRLVDDALAHLTGST
jgi:transposase